MPVCVNELLDIPVGILLEGFQGSLFEERAHFLVFIYFCLYLKEDIQDRHQGGKREDAEPLADKVEHYGPSQILAVGLDVASHDAEELFQHAMIGLFI